MSGLCVTRLHCTFTRGKIGYNTEGKTQAVPIKGVQKGEDRRRYKKEGQTIYKSRGYERGGMVGDNAEKKNRGYTNQRRTQEGRICDSAKRKNIGQTNPGAYIGGRIGDNTKRKTEGMQIQRGQKGENL